MVSPAESENEVGSRYPGAVTAREVGDRIAARLTKLRSVSLTVEDARQLPAGASRATYALVLTDESGRREPMIVRAVPAAHDGDGGLATEAEVLAAAARAEVAVPEILDAGTDAATSVLGYPYLVMSFVAGESIPRRILRDDTYGHARERFVGQAGATLGRIHRIDPADTPQLPVLSDPIAALRELFGRAFDEMPAGLLLATRWLEANRPTSSGRQAVVHGDFRLGNFLIDGDGIAAVLDWELAHIGDPLEDLGWLCAKAWRFGVPRPVAGMGERAALLDAYAEETGQRPAESDLRWWELYATVRWGLICAVQANRHLDGTERSVELAAIGRRSAEQEFDALLDLGIVTPESLTDPLNDPAESDETPHGSPSASDLLEAVSEYLRSAEVSAEASSQVKFHNRVAANVIDVVRRQVLVGAADAAASAERLTRLGVAGQDELVAALRAGTLDDRDPQVRAAVADDVRARLRVANPKYAAIPHP